MALARLTLSKSALSGLKVSLWDDAAGANIEGTIQAYDAASDSYILADSQERHAVQFQQFTVEVEDQQLVLKVTQCRRVRLPPTADGVAAAAQTDTGTGSPPVAMALRGLPRGPQQVGSMGTQTSFHGSQSEEGRTALTLGSRGTASPADPDCGTAAACSSTSNPAGSNIAAAAAAVAAVAAAAAPVSSHDTSAAPWMIGSGGSAAPQAQPDTGQGASVGQRLARDDSTDTELTEEVGSSEANSPQRSRVDGDGAFVDEAHAARSSLALPSGAAMSLASRLRSQVGDSGSWGSFCSSPDAGSPQSAVATGRWGSGTRSGFSSMLAPSARALALGVDRDGAGAVQASGAEADMDTETPVSGSTPLSGAAPEASGMPPMQRWQSGGGIAGGGAMSAWPSPGKPVLGGGRGTAAGFHEISRKISTDADLIPMPPQTPVSGSGGGDAPAGPPPLQPANSASITLAAMLAAESLASQPVLLENDDLEGSGSPLAGDYTIASVLDVSVRASPGRSSSRRVSRTASAAALASTDEGLAAAIHDIPQPLGSRRASRSSRSQVTADGAVAPAASAPSAGLLAQPPPPLGVGPALSGAGGAAAELPWSLSGSVGGVRRGGRSASARASNADQDWGMTGGLAGVASLAAAEVFAAGAGLPHMPGPTSRRASRTLSGRLPPDQDTAAAMGSAALGEGDPDVLPRPVGAVPVLSTIASRRESRAASLTGRATPDSDGFGYSEFEGAEPLVPPEEAVAAALAEAQQQQQQLRRRSTRTLPELDQEPRAAQRVPHSSAGGAATYAAHGAQDPQTRGAAVEALQPLTRLPSQQTAPLLRGGSLVPAAAAASGVPSLRTSTSGGQDDGDGGPPSRRSSQGMSSILQAAAAVAAAAESFVGYALGSSSGAGGRAGGAAASVGASGSGAAPVEGQTDAMEREGFQELTAASVASRALSTPSSRTYGAGGGCDSFTLPALPFSGAEAASAAAAAAAAAAATAAAEPVGPQRGKGAKLPGMLMPMGSGGHGAAGTNTIAVYRASGELAPAAADGSLWGSGTSRPGSETLRYPLPTLPGGGGGLEAQATSSGRARAAEVSPFGLAASRLAAKSVGIAGAVAALNAELAPPPPPQSEIRAASDEDEGSPPPRSASVSGSPSGFAAAAAAAAANDGSAAAERAALVRQGAQLAEDAGLSTALRGSPSLTRARSGRLPAAGAPAAQLAPMQAAGEEEEDHVPLVAARTSSAALGGALKGMVPRSVEEHHAQLNRVVAVAFLHNAAQWYDTAVFLALGECLASAYFPGASPADRLLALYGVAAAGQALRPVGALVWPRVAARTGQRVAAAWALGMSAFATAFTAAMPTYTQAGMVGAGFVAVMRLVQGFALGAGAGDYTSPLVFLWEHAPEYPALHAALAPLAVVSGAAGAAAMSLFFASVLSAATLADWGWRLPLVLSLAVNGVASALRWGLVSEPDAHMSVGEVGDRRGEHLGRVVRGHEHASAQVVLLEALPSAMLGLLVLLLPAYLVVYAGCTPAVALLVHTVNLGVLAVAVPLGGYLADSHGRTHLLLGCAAAALVLAYPLWLLFGVQLAGAAWFAQFVMTAMAGLATGAGADGVAAAYPKGVRCSGLALSHTLAASLFGGFAPLVAVALVAASGSGAAPAFVMMACAVLTAAGAWLSRRSAGQGR